MAATKKGSIIISEIQIIINRGDSASEEDKKHEVPMFDQTMSILEMIKEKKVIIFEPSEAAPGKPKARVNKIFQKIALTGLTTKLHLWCKI